MFEHEIVRKQIYCIKESTCVCWDFSAASVVIWGPHSNSAPGELCPLATTLVWAQFNEVFAISVATIRGYLKKFSRSYFFTNID